MATIKEMSLITFPKEIKGNGWNECDINEKERKGFVVGANAVLEKIENAMDLGEPPCLISVEQAYYIIENCIKQLKGE